MNKIKVALIVVVGLAIVLAGVLAYILTDGFLSVEQRHAKAMEEFARSNAYHAQICTNGSEIIAYRSVLLETPKDDGTWERVIRIVGQKTMDERGRVTIELHKGSVELVPAMFSWDKDRYEFKGSEVRTLAHGVFNRTTKQDASSSIEAYKDEVVRAVFELPYADKAHFNLKDYAIVYGIWGGKLFVAPDWECEYVDDATYDKRM